MLGTADELASAVAGGIPFLIQPPIPPIAMSESDLQHLIGLYRFDPNAEPVASSRPAIAAMYYPATRTLVLRAWLEDANGVLQLTPLQITSTAEIYGEDGEAIAHAVAALDPAGGNFLTLTFQVALALSHSYKVRARLEWLAGSFDRDFGFSVTR